MELPLMKVGAMSRYSLPLTIMAVAGVAVGTIRLLPPPWDDGAYVWVAMAFILVGLGWLLVRLVTTTPSEASPAGFLRWLETDRYAAPAAIVLSACLLIAGSFALSPDWFANPLFWIAAALFTFGQIVWLIRLGGAPHRPGARLVARRLLAATLLTAPTVPFGLYVFAVILAQGDNAWMGLPMALPGVVAAPFAVVAYWRILARRRAGG